MEKLKVQVNDRVYFLKTDKQEAVLDFAEKYDELIRNILVKMHMTEVEATGLAALLLMGETLDRGRSEEDEAFIEEQNGRIEVLEERVDTLAREIASHNDTEDALRTEISGLRDREEGLLAKISELSEREQELSDDYEEANSALDDTKSALSSANKLIAKLNTERFAEVAAREALEKELDASSAKLDAANKLIAELNGKLTNMEINTISVSDGKIVADEEEIKKLRREKEDIEIELAISKEENGKLREQLEAVPQDESEQAKKIADYEKQIKQLEARSAEIDKLRNILAETEHSIRHKVDEKEEENTKLRGILKNYENSYSVCVEKKEAEIMELQREVERLRQELKIKTDEEMNGPYVQPTFDSDEAAAKKDT